MSNVIKSNYIYVARDDKRVIDFNKSAAQPVIPGISDEDDGGFKSIDYTDESYKVDAVQKTETNGDNFKSPDIEFAMSELENIRREANELIENAKQEAEDILARANEEANRLREQTFEDAKNEGYAQGYDIAQNEISNERVALKVQEQTILCDYENKVCELEKTMVDITASLIERIAGIEIGDADVIGHIIHRAFNNIENSKDYLIKVSAKDYETVTQMKDSLYECVREGSVIDVVVDDSLTKNQCIIETDVNVIDASLNEQLRNVAKELRLLSLE